MGTFTVDQLMSYAESGRLSKHALATLLTGDSRRAFLDACASLERHYTEACTAAHDHCLASGCALEGEVCLQPLLNAGSEYNRACGAAWIPLFRNPANRVEGWQYEHVEA
jgi:hypothetical protein